MTGMLISLAQQQVATVLAAGLADPAGIIAVTGDPGLGKSVTVATVIREQGLTAWLISPAVDDISAKLALLYKAKSMAKFVLVIDDAHTLPVPTLTGLFALLARDRSAFPRVIFVARPAFWRLFDDPALAGARDRICTVAVLFPMDPAESERFLCHGLGTANLRPWARTMLHDARGNPGLLSRAIGRCSPPPVRVPQPKRRVLATRNLSGPLAFLVLGLAMAALALSLTEPSQPPRSAAVSMSPPGIAP